MHVNFALHAYFASNLSRSKTSDPTTAIQQASAQTAQKFSGTSDAGEIRLLAQNYGMAVDPRAQAAADLKDILRDHLGGIDEPNLLRQVNSGLTDAIQIATKGQAAMQKQAQTALKASHKPKTVQAQAVKTELTSTDRRDLNGAVNRWLERIGEAPGDRTYVGNHLADAKAALQASSHGKKLDVRFIDQFLNEYTSGATFGTGAPNRTFDGHAIQQPQADRWTALPDQHGGEILGRPSIEPSMDTASALYRTAQGEDRSAAALANAGYTVRQMHDDDYRRSRPLTDDSPGLNPQAIPDFVITAPGSKESHFFDCFTPTGSDLGGITNTLRNKAGTGQARRLVVNLDQMDVPVTPRDMKKVVEDAFGNQGFALQPGQQHCLEELLVIQNDQVCSFYFKPLQFTPASNTLPPVQPPEVGALKLGTLGEAEFSAAAAKLEQDVRLDGKGSNALLFQQSLGPVVEAAAMPEIHRGFKAYDPTAQVVSSIQIYDSDDPHKPINGTLRAFPEIDALAVTTGPTANPHEPLHLVSIKKDGDIFNAGTDKHHLQELRTTLPNPLSKSCWVKYVDANDGQTKFQPLDQFRQWIGQDPPKVWLSTPSDANTGKNHGYPNQIPGPTTGELKKAVVSLQPSLASQFSSHGVW